MQYLAESIQLTRDDLANRTAIPFTPDPPRLPGIHASDLIRSIAIRSGKLKENRKFAGRDLNLFDADADPEQYPMLWALGVAWEEFCVSLYDSIVFKPPAQSLRGIAVTPDGIDSITWAMHEFKLTWKSSKESSPDGRYRDANGKPLRVDRPIESHELYLWQVKGYCKVYETRKAVIHVMYVNGSWGFEGEGPQPEYVRYSLVFEDWEIEENWQMLEREKVRFEKAGRIQ
jgi:hypothetical protein